MDGKGWICTKCSEKVPKNILPNDGLTDDLPWDRIRKKRPNKQIQAKWKTRSQWSWLSGFTLPETHSSPLKIGYSIPSQKEIHLPTMHFQVRAVSFREGTFPFTTCWLFCLIIFSPISLSVGGFIPGSTLVIGWVVGFAGVKNLILTTIAGPPYCRREMSHKKNHWNCFLVGGLATHLKNISQIGSFVQVGVKIKNIWNHHLVTFTPYHSPFWSWLLF